jgi:hypothetical protein
MYRVNKNVPDFLETKFPWSPLTFFVFKGKLLWPLLCNKKLAKILSKQIKNVHNFYTKEGTKAISFQT